MKYKVVKPERLGEFGATVMSEYKNGFYKKTYEIAYKNCFNGQIVAQCVITNPNKEQFLKITKYTKEIKYDNTSIYKRVEDAFNALITQLLQEKIIEEVWYYGI